MNSAAVLCFGCALACSAPSAGKQRSGCEWDSYDAVKFDTPIRGGHDQLATVKVLPGYPETARQSALRGTVRSEVLIDRSGNVVKTCSRGQPAFVKAVDAALMKWKFVKDFGIVSETPDRGRQYAVLTFTFEFDPDRPNTSK